MPLLHSGRNPLPIESIPHANGHSAGTRRRKCHFKPLVFNVSTFPSVCAGFGVVRSARYRFDHWSKHVNWPFRGGRRGPTACPNCTKLGIRVEETRRGPLGRFEPKATLHMPLLQSVRDPLSIESAPHDAGGQALGREKALPVPPSQRRFPPSQTPYRSGTVSAGQQYPSKPTMLNNISNAQNNAHDNVIQYLHLL